MSPTAVESRKTSSTCMSHRRKVMTKTYSEKCINRTPHPDQRIDPSYDKLSTGNIFERMASFKNLSFESDHMRPISLARAGFSLTTKGKTECQFCKLELDDGFQGGDYCPLYFHKQQSPTCSFLSTTQEDGHNDDITQAHFTVEIDSPSSHNQRFTELTPVTGARPEDNNPSNAQPPNEAATSTVSPDVTSTLAASLEVNVGALDPQQFTTEAPSSGSSKSKRKRRRKKKSKDRTDMIGDQSSGAGSKTATHPTSEQTSSDDSEPPVHDAGDEPTTNTTTCASSAQTPTENDGDYFRLKMENLKLKQASLCKVCMWREIAVVFLPCAHLVCCSECATKVNTCPVCRAVIRATIDVPDYRGRNA